MRVLVTGGAGLIGFHAAKRYAMEGHKVTVFDNLERQALLGHPTDDRRALFNIRALRALPSEHRIEWYEGDVSSVTDWTGLLEVSYGQGFDLILHYAAQCGVPTSIARPRRDFEINVLGTFNALEHARQFGSTVCYASTNKVYPLHDGTGDGQIWLRETHEPRWRWKDESVNLFGWPERMVDGAARTPYGQSKYTGDLLCQEYYHTYGVKTGIFRMSCIYGPNQFGFEEQGWATWFAIAALKGYPITLYGDGKQVRDMLFVEDCVDAYHRFAASELRHGVWNLGGGTSNTMSLLECLGMLPELTGCELPPITYQDWRPLDQKVYITDIRKVMHDLDWEPKTNIFDGYRKTCNWAQDHREIF